jgi:hypothetical protein
MITLTVITLSGFHCVRNTDHITQMITGHRRTRGEGVGGGTSRQKVQKSKFSKNGTPLWNF